MGFTGLKTYPYNISPSRAGGRDWKKRSDRNEKMRKRRSDWEDESGSDIKTGIECGAKGDVRRDRDHSNLSKCVCVCLCVCVCAYASTRRASVSPRMWLDCRFLCLRMSLCVTVCVSGCLSAHPCEPLVCVSRARMYVWQCGGGGGGGGEGGRRRAASRGRRDRL